MKNIGMKIRAVRKALGMTLQQVALAAGYDAGNLSKLERGLVDWSGTTLQALADAMDVPVYFFFLTQDECQIIDMWQTLGAAERSVIVRMAGHPERSIEPPVSAKLPLADLPRGPALRPTVRGKTGRLQTRYLPPSKGESL